jgi:hypothetical protein
VTSPRSALASLQSSTSTELHKRKVVAQILQLIGGIELNDHINSRAFSEPLWTCICGLARIALLTGKGLGEDWCQRSFRSSFAGRKGSFPVSQQSAIK